MRSSQPLMLLAFLAVGLLSTPRGRAEVWCDAEVNDPAVPGLRGEVGEVRTTGIQRLLFLRIRFPDDVADPISETDAEAVLAGADQAFRRMSYGAFGLDATISPVLLLPIGRESYAGPGGFDRFVEDARAAGAAAGFDYLDYDLDVVRHSGVPGFAGGNARIGVRGAQVQADGVVILLHELGHNLGLLHANFWNTSAPGISLGSPPLPSNYESLPDPRTVPVYPDSAVGHETVTGPGAALEYGDPWDIMGSGDTDFSVAYKEYLGWLPSAAVAQAGAGLAVYHLVAAEGARPGDGVTRAVRLPGVVTGERGVRDLIVELPVRHGEETPLPGVVVRWTDGTSSWASTLLLDVTPGTPVLNADAVLAPGRAFSDPSSDVHVTVLAAGGEGAERWTEVAIARGVSAGNRPPSLAMETNDLRLEPGDSTELQVEVIDPDGDEVAVHWDFGDGEIGACSPAVTKAWSRAGDYVVRVEAGDLKGGTASAFRLVRVGEPRTFRIVGRVRDPSGNPVAGARVHNGVTRGDGHSEPRVTALSDGEGRYALTGLTAGTYPCGAFCPGYLMDRVPAVVLSPEGDAIVQLDFTARPLPRVSVEGVPSLPESAGFTEVFTIRRSGPTNEPLTVFYRLGGTAGPGDYARPLLDWLVLPAGSSSVVLALAIFDDQETEPGETLQLTVTVPTRSTRVSTEGTPYTVSYPGYDYVEIDGTHYWVLTEPEYGTGLDASAEVVILDDDLPPLQDLRIAGPPGGQVRVAMRGSPGSQLVLETSQDLLEWLPIRTNRLFTADPVEVVLPNTGDGRWFRTVQTR